MPGTGLPGENQADPQDAVVGETLRPSRTLVFSPLPPCDATEAVK